jgi:hypothetical protein
MASRLQKLGSLSFAVSRRGLDPAECMPANQKHFIVKKTSIRGIGDDELIILPKSDFDALPEQDKKLFH